MRSQIEIAKANERDVPVILDLIRQLTDYESGSPTSASRPRTGCARRCLANVRLPRSCSPNCRTKRQDSLSSSPITPRFWQSPASTWRTCSSSHICVARASARRYCADWRRSQPSAIAVASSGPFLTGTRRPSASTSLSAAVPLKEWTTFRLTGEPLQKLATLPPRD